MGYLAPSCMRVVFAHHYEAWTVTVRTDVSEDSDIVNGFRVSGSTPGLETQDTRASGYLSKRLESRESRGTRRRTSMAIICRNVPGTITNPLLALAPPARSLQDSMHASLRRHAQTAVHTPIHLHCCLLSLMLPNTSHLLSNLLLRFIALYTSTDPALASPRPHQ
jgi:hypothetical protein